MPIYEFECTGCGTTTERLQRIGEDEPRCSGCGEPMQRVLSLTGGVVVREASFGHAHAHGEGPCCGQAGGCDQPKRCCEN